MSHVNASLTYLEENRVRMQHSAFIGRYQLQQLTRALSMYIPDPIERMESRIEDMADDVFGGLPIGQARCPGCKKVMSDNDLITVSPAPDSPVCCYDCLSPEDQLAYDDFCNKMDIEEAIREAIKAWEAYRHTALDGRHAIYIIQYLMAMPNISTTVKNTEYLFSEFDVLVAESIAKGRCDGKSN